MVLSYNNVRQKWRQQRMKAPPSQAISIAMAVRRCNIAFNTQCSMTRASPEAEATERRHRATSHSVSPGQPPGQQSTQQLCKMYPLCWSFWWPSRCGGNTTCIAQWRRFVAKRRHRVSTRSDIINWTCLPLFQGYIISLSNCWKRAQVALITIGVWHIKLMRST
jgi:hypothetical protein